MVPGGVLIPAVKGLARDLFLRRLGLIGKMESHSIFARNLFGTRRTIDMDRAIHYGELCLRIVQPEPMSLGGIASTLAVAAIARGAGGWIAPHQSGGPVATSVCLQLAACVPNFLIQECFDPFNEPWTRDLVSWTPTIDANTGHVDLPSKPGIGLTLNLDVANAHPYDPQAYLDVHQEGSEQRLGSAAIDG